MRVLTELHCLPAVGIFKSWLTFDEIVFESCENYQKRSFRNRFYLNSSSGPVLCSIPLCKGKNQQLPIREVRISYDENWIRLLERMIVSNYRSAAYFDFYFESLLDVFRHRPEYLFELNISLWHWLESSLKISVNYSLSDDYMAHPDSHTLIDWRNKWRSRRDLNDTKAYAQVFEYRHGFVSGLSVLDLVFCCGPESIAILKETN